MNIYSLFVGYVCLLIAPKKISQKYTCIFSQKLKLVPHLTYQFQSYLKKNYDNQTQDIIMTLN